MVFKKYAVEDNCWAKLASSIDANTTRIRIKNAHNLPQSGERIATLAKKQGDEIIKMEKVLVLRREIDLLIVQRGFQSTAQAWDENDVINLFITAEIIRDLQNCLSAIDESDLVHKSGDEEIGGVKTFQEGFIFKKKQTDFDVHDLSFSKNNPKETQTISQYAKATNGTPGGIYFVDYVSATPDWLGDWRKEFRGYLKIGDSVRTFDHFQGRGYEGFDGTEASLPNVRKFIKLEAPKIILNDVDILGEWQSRTPSVAYGLSEVGATACRYKKIGKTLMITGHAIVKPSNTQEFAISLPYSVRDSGCAVELRGPGSFQFTRGAGQCSGGSLRFHAGDNNIPLNQSVSLRFTAILELI